MKTRIRKSHGGKFIVGHRSVHYHQIFSNVLLKRHVARSGNMHVRNSTKHFLNVKMASYAVPSFSLFDASIASVEDTEHVKENRREEGQKKEKTEAYWRGQYHVRYVRTFRYRT